MVDAGAARSPCPDSVRVADYTDMWPLAGRQSAHSHDSFRVADDTPRASNFASRNHLSGQRWHLSGNATYQDLTQLQSLESLQPVDKRALVVTNEGAEEAL